MAMPPPRVAAPNPFHRQPTSLKNSPFLNRLNGVGRTGWLEPTLVRTEQRRYSQLVDADGEDEEPLDHSRLSCRFSRLPYAGVGMLAALACVA